MTREILTGARDSTGAVPRPRDAPIPFGRLVSVEVRKAVDTRAAKAVLGTFIVLGMVVLGLSLFQEPEASLATGAVPAVMIVPGFPIIGVLVMTSEWSQRTAMTTFRLVPRRRRVLAAKVVAALAISVLTVSALLVVCLSITAVTLGARGDSLTTAGLGDAVHVAYVSVVTAAVFGLAWGALLRSTPLALVVTIVASLVADIALTFALGDLAPWFRTGTFADWVLGESALSLPVVTALTLWYVAPLVVGCWLQTRWEVR